MAEKKNTVKKTGAKSNTRAKTTQKKKPMAKGKTHEEQNKGLSYQTKAILMLGIAAVLMCVILIESGGVWLWAHNFFAGLFGFCAILIPLFLLYIAIITALEKRLAEKQPES